MEDFAKNERILSKNQKSNISPEKKCCKNQKTKSAGNCENYEATKLRKLRNYETTKSTKTTKYEITK